MSTSSDSISTNTRRTSSTSGSSTTVTTTPTSTASFPSLSDISRPTGNSGPGPSSNMGSSATLYLYTFLATLVLLLGVSAAIVIRSILLRRRHQAMMEEAIRNGTWRPPTSGRGVRVDPSMKPRFFSAHLALPVATAPESNSKEKLTEGPYYWDSIMPFSVANPLPVVAPTPASAPAPAPVPPNQPFFVSRFRSILRRTPPDNEVLPTTAPILITPPTPSAIPMTPMAMTSITPPAPETLNVAVLIAMPSPTPLHTLLMKNQSAEEDDLPYIEVGVAVVPVGRERRSEENLGVSLEDGTRKGSMSSSVEA